MGKMGGKWGQRPGENGDSARGKMGTAPGGKWGQRPGENGDSALFFLLKIGRCPHFPPHFPPFSPFSVPIFPHFSTSETPKYPFEHEACFQPVQKQ